MYDVQKKTGHQKPITYQIQQAVTSRVIVNKMKRGANIV